MDNVSKYTFAKNTIEIGKVDGNINKIQDSAISAARSARRKVQVALVATACHLATHHDVRIARRLYDGLKETVRGRAIIQWLQTYGHLEVGEVKVQEGGSTKTIKTFTKCKGNAGQHEKAVRASLNKAKSTMWWDFKVPDDFAGFDADKALKRVIDQVNKARERIDSGKHVANDAEVVMPSASTIESVCKLCNFDAVIKAA